MKEVVSDLPQDTISVSNVSLHSKPEYSENEMRLIQHISEHWHTLITERKTGSIGPMAVFRFLAEECFMLNKTGSYVEAFRRGYRALTYQGVLRFTEEYEKLIEVEIDRIYI